MLSTTRTGEVWRIAPCGTTPVYLLKLCSGGTAEVCSRGRKGWAIRSMTISATDLFETRVEALVEYRARRAAAGTNLNLTTDWRVSQ